MAVSIGVISHADTVIVVRIENNSGRKDVENYRVYKIFVAGI